MLTEDGDQELTGLSGRSLTRVTLQNKQLLLVTGRPLAPPGRVEEDSNHLGFYPGSRDWDLAPWQDFNRKFPQKGERAASGEGVRSGLEIVKKQLSLSTGLN